MRHSRVPRRGQWSGALRAPCSDRGVALPGVLLLSAFLVAVTGWLVGHVRADLTWSGLADADEEGERTAQAALEAAAMALAGVPDWGPVGALSVPLDCPGASRGLAPLDASAERTRVQMTVDAGGRWGTDGPRFVVGWICHAEGVLGRWPAGGDIPSVVVLIADDPEGDARPDVSTNERLLLRAVARGAARSRAEVAATVARSGPGAPVLLAALRRQLGR